jgi:hypothetical protein
MTNLEPFNLRFPLYCGTGWQGFYFISSPLNYNLQTKCETVDMNKWGVDSVLDVYIQEKIHYKQSVRLYQSPKNSVHLKYEFDTKTSKLKILWMDYQPKTSDVELVIKFYSVSQQREKTINQLFNDESE